MRIELRKRREGRLFSNIICLITAGIPIVCVYLRQELFLLCSSIKNPDLLGDLQLRACFWKRRAWLVANFGSRDTVPVLAYRLQRTVSILLYMNVVSVLNDLVDNWHLSSWQFETGKNEGENEGENER